MTIHDTNLKHKANNIFAGVLGEYYDKGFSLTEPDDHNLNLYYEGKLIKQFPQETVMVQEIKAYCVYYLNLVTLRAEQLKDTDKDMMLKRHIIRGF